MREAKFIGMIKKVTRKTNANGDQELQIDFRVPNDHAHSADLQILKNNLFEDMLMIQMAPHQIDLTKEPEE